VVLAAALIPPAAGATLRIDTSIAKVCRPITMVAGPDPYLYSIALYGQFPVVHQSQRGLQVDEAALRAAKLIVTQPGRKPERIPYDPRLAIQARRPSFALARYGEPAHIVEIVYDTRQWCRKPGKMKIHFELNGESADYVIPIITAGG
jgi:hypothetical protein